MADFLVTRLDDSDDPGLSGLSLRQALAEATVAPGADRVLFADGLSGEIVLAGGPLRVSDATTVLGPQRGGDGAPLIVVDGAGGGRVFEVEGAVTLGRLAIEGGRAQGAGGGIFAAADGDLTLTDVAIRDNSAASGSGIYLGEGASLAIRSSEITDNRPDFEAADLRGGGIFGAGGNVVTIDDTIVRSNYAPRGGGAHLRDADVTITNSVFNDNGNFFGAHIGLYGASSLFVRDSEITRIYGGGISTSDESTIDIETAVTVGRRDVGKGAFYVEGGQGADRVVIEPGFHGEMAFRGSDGANLAIGGDGDDTIVGAEDPSDPESPDGADRFFGRGGNDQITGGYDDDFLNAGPGSDFLQGGAGDDTLIAGPDGGDFLNGGAGDDVFVLLAPKTGGEGARIEDFGGGDRVALDDRLFLGTALEGITDMRYNPRVVTDAAVAAAFRSGVVEYDEPSGILALLRATSDDPLGDRLELLQFDSGTGLAGEDFVLI